MKKVFYVLIFVSLSLQTSAKTAQIHADDFDKNVLNKDTLGHLKKTHDLSKLSLLTYVRVISDSKGAVRTDENIVTNFRLLNWLKLELGLRYGERPGRFNSYYHYKVELQTKPFWNTTRFIARISDDVISFPHPAYKKTNGLFAVETKLPIAHSFQGIVAGGYLFSSQAYTDIGPLPTSRGTETNYPLFKLALRYLMRNKGFTELVYGSYDVFNPYELNRPFTQIGYEYEFNSSCSLYSYARYQYNNNLLRSYNYFLGLGVKFNFSKAAEKRSLARAWLRTPAHLPGQ